MAKAKKPVKETKKKTEVLVTPVTEPIVVPAEEIKIDAVIEVVLPEDSVITETNQTDQPIETEKSSIIEDASEIEGNEKKCLWCYIKDAVKWILKKLKLI